MGISNVAYYEKWLLINKILNEARKIAGKPLRSEWENPYSFRESNGTHSEEEL